MISYDEAVRLIADSVSPLPARTVPLGEAFAATAAHDLRSGADVPSFANAAMDGYALASAATAQASAREPLALEIAGHITAGQPPPTPVGPACAWEIMTGAPMPLGCDAVLPVERARLRPATPTRPATLLVEEPVDAGRNRREAGSDIAVGDLLLRAGQRIHAVAMMALAAAGFDTLPVRPRPRIAVLTTGSELADTGLPDAAGMIRDANGPYLDAVLASLQLAPARRRSVSDDAGRVARDLAGLAQDSDLIITTGGVSAGR
ncbi:MAG: molybdopterin-binding protein, partial [Gammaproteobacteria bacterium]|nr:molybdopterin-binding protein [Gammaproteobacteria bacterium]